MLPSNSRRSLATNGGLATLGFNPVRRVMETEHRAAALRIR